MARGVKSDRPRVALILAAGQGSRLRPHTSEVPKCLLDLGGETILGYQVRCFKAAGLDEIIIVTGYRADLIEEALADVSGCRFVFNEAYATTNSLASLALAREAVGGRPFVLVNGDVLFHHQILDLLLEAPGASGLTLDPAGGSGPEEMKVAIRDGLVERISKELPAEESDGENLGLLKFGRTGGEILFREAKALVEAGREGQWAPFAYNLVLQQDPIHVVDVGGRPWIEIDTPVDLECARGKVYPLLQEGLGDA